MEMSPSSDWLCFCLLKMTFGVQIHMHGCGTCVQMQPSLFFKIEVSLRPGAVEGDTLTV